MEKVEELKKVIIKKERDRIELDLMEYMEGTFLEQDSIYLNLHDIINKNYEN